MVVDDGEDLVRLDEKAVVLEELVLYHGLVGWFGWLAVHGFWL